MEKPVTFFVTNAFTDRPFGGNPAAVIFLDHDLPITTLLEIAKNFNQPIATFLLPSSTRGDAHTKNFRVRWFTTVIEIGLCGHGTLAAAGTIFATQDPEANLNTLNFETTDGRVVSARRVGEGVEISLASAAVEQPDIETQEKLESIVRRSLQKDDISVHFVGVGRKGFEKFMMVEIDVKDDLANCEVDSTAFLETGYMTNVITSVSRDQDIAFVSRMFAPAVEVNEDHVCGSAHCLLVPYWSQKLGIEPSGTMLAEQVSARGGDLKVAWREAEGKVTLQGEVKITMTGELWL